MEANNIQQLQKQIMRKMEKAMELASEKMLADMYKATGEFYAGGEPAMYERTGALGDTPRTTAVKVSGNTASFEAYLDTDHQYTSGSNPSMEQVLYLANYGIPFETANGHRAKDTVGRKAFWDKAKYDMEKTFKKTIEDYMT